MEKVRKNTWKVQRKKQAGKKTYESLDLNAKASIIKAFIPLGLIAVEELLY